jgi:23S rRNA (cytidine1920-2'-O)/16S rRNA (cytidine1409-2'-O)-methyltransferase
VLRGAVASPLPGPSGNVEYFLRLARSGSDAGDGVLAAAVEEGP